jgi:uridylate kinase
MKFILLRRKTKKMNKPRIVIKLSGSIFNFETNYKIISSYTNLLKKINEDYQPIIVTGGGKIARFYINLSRSLGFDESGLDLIGIQVSHLNAKLLISGLGDICYPITPRNLDEISIAVISNKIIITGGLFPGQSTNATSALIAEKIRAIKFFNATDVEGIFDMDPRTNPYAKLFESISVKDCINILKVKNSMAGTYDLMDLISLKVIERSKLPTLVFKSTVDNIQKVILEHKKMGTEIII